MKLFRLRNKARFSSWVVAKDLDQAKQLFLDIGFAKKIENISLVGDQTSFYLNRRHGTSLKKLLESGGIGIAAAHSIDGWKIAAKRAK